MYNDSGKYKIWVGENEEKPVNETIKYSKKKIMVWNVCLLKVLVICIFLDRNMNALYYVEILANNLPSSMSKFGFVNFKLLQDGDPKHRSKLVRECFEFNNIKLIEWASQSPDLNPIENLWVIIKRRLKGIEFNGINEMKEIIQEAW
ncbi:TCB2 [Hepatospora eriocheir]|uniref:TCB2 n=2 Tax=Hepatospora eriocheir TaxID=1081669 RepID=A0A1X0Q7E6_9MICR|nr:TCB2 [Hepatospora eriocheir]